MSIIMKAVIKDKPQVGFVIKEVPIPEIGPSDVLVKVLAASICGTDIHIYEWDNWAKNRIKLPLIVGHEFAGKVVKIGKNVSKVKIGDFVSAESHIVCNNCYACRLNQAHLCVNTKILGIDRAGCFAEYVALPQENIVVNSKKIPLNLASAQEPLGNAVNVVLENQVAGKTVLITGAGPTGLAACAIAKICGATLIIVSDLSSYRRNLAKKMGANYIINPQKDNLQKKVRQLTNQEGVDIVFEMSGSESAFLDALHLVKNGGYFNAFGIPKKKIAIEWAKDVIFKGIKINGISGRKICHSWDTLKNFLNSGRLDFSPMITHEFPLEKVNQAMKLMQSGRCGKIILRI
jgi:threonine 3-dehydrogenase